MWDLPKVKHVVEEDVHISCNRVHVSSNWTSLWIYHRFQLDFCLYDLFILVRERHPMQICVLSQVHLLENSTLGMFSPLECGIRIVNTLLWCLCFSRHSIFFLMILLDMNMFRGYEFKNKKKKKNLIPSSIMLSKRSQVASPSHFILLPMSFPFSKWTSHIFGNLVAHTTSINAWFPISLCLNMV